MKGKISQIIYHYPSFLLDPPIRWHETFKNIPVTYEEGLPDDADYWSSIPKNSLVVIDDLWSQAAENDHICMAFKCFSRHKHYNIIIISQNYFDRGRNSVSIRNNLNIVVLFENSSNRDVNKKIARSLGYLSEYKLAKKRFESKPFSHIMFYVSPDVEKQFRVVSNLFGKNHPFFPIFHLSHSLQTYLK